MLDLKGKFRRAKARIIYNDVVGWPAVLAVPGIIVGVPLAFTVDGGATLMASTGVLFGSGMMLSRDQMNECEEYAKKGYFQFDGKSYYTGERQGLKLIKLQTKIDGLKKSFNDAKTNKKRVKIEKKIQKLVDHQIDILKPANITTEKPVPPPPEKLKELNIKTSFSKKPKPN